MSDDIQGSTAGTSVDNGAADVPAPARETGSRRLPKKRTKTGCLTCRKRRIKCGEEKPICNNCIKSRRNCEGYSQRVVFKNPLGVLAVGGPSQALDLQMQQHMRVPLFNEYKPLPAQQAAAAAQHPMLAPRPVDGLPTTHITASQSHAGSLEMPRTVNAPQFYYPTPPVRGYPPTQPSKFERKDSVSSAVFDYSPPRQPESLNTGLSGDQSQLERARQYTQSTTEAESVPGQSHPFVSATTLYNEQPDQSDFVHTSFPQSLQSSGTMYHHYSQYPEQLPPQFDSPRQFLPQSEPQIIYVDDEAEDYYDVDSDEEMADQTQTEGFNQLNLIMSSATHDDSRLRSFTTLLNEPNVLANYFPSLGSSPLNNPKTARIFAHFIHSTGPSLSIFERHQTDSSIALGGKVPLSQQGLWTYTLPLKALEHPALLQAVLAISSLHIAYLQETSTTVSLKHYHYALKRIGKAVGLPTRRKQIGTLAATKLLAYYEVISADHSKWNSHVAGAAQLVREIDFAGITRDLRAHRRRIAEQRREIGWPERSTYYPNFGATVSEDDPFAEKEGSVDEAFISSIMGRAIRYDFFGRVEDGYMQSHKKHFTRKDIENFRIQSDLYWWFNKHDLFHSLLSADKLFLPFDLRGQCPPRAGIGRIDAIYGSADHLWLLLARVSDFGYRDRKRKLKALRASGGEWRPNPGMFKFMARFANGVGPPGGRKPPSFRAPPAAPSDSSAFSAQSGLRSASPSGSSRTTPLGNPSSAAEGPPMYGMIPPRGPARLPSGFDDPRRGQRESSEEDDGSEDLPYGEAEREWEEILIALDTFAKALGRDFQPLPADVTHSISTPFGPALQYRTNTIAVIWGFYYMGRILLHRLHPSMPPAMTMASAVAAPTTAEYAQIIGKIMGGIYYPQSYNLAAGSLSPTLGTSLTEMTLPIFFAAVQYVDPAQRGWTIAKLKDISRLTGWKSSDSIAGGCEKAWIIAAKHGRGPPYHFSLETDEIRANHQLDALERHHQSGGTQLSNDRRFVTVTAPDRPWLPLGLLSLESNMSNLDLDP